MATLSAAVAFTVIVPETVAPELGDIIDRLRGVLTGWLLELTSPAQPEFIKATNKMTNSHPPRLIPHVNRASPLSKFMVGFPQYFFGPSKAPKDPYRRFFATVVELTG
jgi:hypothetical protein